MEPKNSLNINIQYALFSLLVLNLGALIWAVLNSTSLLGWDSSLTITFWIKLGNQAMLLSLLAMSLFVVRKVFHSKNLNESNWSRKVIIFLSKYHTAIAGAAVLIAVGHGIFFLIYSPDRVSKLYTGLLTFINMSAVVSLGLALQYKKLPLKIARKCHFYTSIFFMMLLIIHIHR